MSRVADHKIDPLFPNRWSPRAMSGEPVSEENLMQLFEAARWAPSSNNNQPWRFIYAIRGTPYFAEFLDLLVEFNQLWAKNAGALVVIVSKTTFENGKESITHSFDTGAAWMSVALQAHIMGLHVHGMQGFDYDRAKTLTGLSDGYAVEAMFAVGHPGELEVLPERMRKGEVPNSRRATAESVFEGRFTAPTPISS